MVDPNPSRFPRLLLLLIFLVIPSPVISVNITNLLSSYPELSTFASLLTSTSVATDLSRRSSLTILAIPNSILQNAFDARNDSSLPSPYDLADVVRYHVLLQYFSLPDLHQIPPEGKLVTTLFQTTGRASTNMGAVNLTRNPFTGNVTIRSPSPFSTNNATIMSLIKIFPYNISIFTVDSLLIPTGLDVMASEKSPPAVLNITQVLIDGKNFNVVASMLTASGVVDEFEADEKGAGITIFVPSDEAFTEMPQTGGERLQSLSADRKAVVLRYHVLHSYYPLGSLESIVNPVQPTLATEDTGAGRFTESVRSSEMKRQLLLQHPHHHRPTKLLFFLFTLFSVVALALLALTLLFSPLSFREDEELDASHRRPYCPNVPDGFICCDRTTSVRSDVCVMRGDIRTRPGSKSIHLYNSKMDNVTRVVEEIRPYTRKWETSVMSTIDQLRLVAIKDNHNNGSDHRCDVMHDSPALVFSTGGYTGNVYHEFNDGIIPLYITSRRFDKKVVFVIVEYHDWWVMKYGNILSQMSYYDPIDFSGDNRTHCFPEVTVGLKIHDELTVESENNMSIANFRNLLDEAYRPRIQSIEKEEEKANRTEKEINSPVEPSVMKKPRLVIVARNGSRGIDNEEDLVNLCEEIGFDVVVIQPTKTTELAKIYRDLNGSDAMIGVHGAAMTHLLFMRPKTAFIQIVPLGTEWAAEAYYGEPARKLGLKYVEYRIVPRESSLYEKYPKDDPVLKDPSSVAAKGWEVTKEVYLDGQSVRLDLNRFLKRITRVYQYAVRRKNTLKMDYDWSWQLPTKNRAPARKEIRKMKKKTILFF